VLHHLDFVVAGELLVEDIPVHAMRHVSGLCRLLS
jgi:hypothetical protein